MPKFVLIDHSLEKIGGHNYEYAIHMVRAAQQAGFDAVLATHRRFRGPTRRSIAGPIFPVFHFDSFHKYCLFSGGELWSAKPAVSSASGRQNFDPIQRGNPNCIPPLQSQANVNIPHVDTTGPGRQQNSSWLSNARQLWRRQRGQYMLNSFSHSCDQLLRRENLREGDIVFLPTMTEFDLLGLVQYLASAPESRRARWLLQFHFDILDGRPPDYEHQSQRIAQLRRHFQQALNQLRHHRITLLNPTKTMVEQYNRLKVAAFHALSYPVNPAFRPTNMVHHHDNPLRIVFAGHFRREKGRHLLSTLVETLSSEMLATGRAQLFIQTSRSRARRLLPRRSTRSLVRHGRDRQPSKSPVVLVRHPLAIEDYVEHIRNANIGLFLYHSRRYYARCSGVLVEMLCSGVPVIVPAGCWLAEQIAEPIYRYQERLLHTRQIISRTDVGRLKASMKMPAGGHQHGRLVFATPSQNAVLLLDVPAQAADLLITFHWQQPQQSGTYVRVDAESSSGSGRVIESQANIVGHRDGRSAVPILIRLQPDAAQVRLTWSNAYHSANISVSDLDFYFLGQVKDTGQSCPLGAVGLIAASSRHVPELLDDMVTHYPHYRRTAVHFSATWRRQHSPRNIFSRLLDYATEADERESSWDCGTVGQEVGST